MKETFIDLDSSSSQNIVVKYKFCLINIDSSLKFYKILNSAGYNVSVQFTIKKVKIIVSIFQGKNLKMTI